MGPSAGRELQPVEEAPWQVWLIAWGKELGRNCQAWRDEQSKRLDGTKPTINQQSQCFMFRQEVQMQAAGEKCEMQGSYFRDRKVIGNAAVLGRTIVRWA